MNAQTADKYTLLQNAQQVIRELSAEELQAVLNFIKALQSEDDQARNWSAEW